MRIETVDLVHEYREGQRALDGVSLVIEGTDPVAVVGQNGAGKTTLVKHFNGILRPTSGHVLIDGQDVAERSCAQWSASVGYVFQNPDNQLFLESVRKELEFGPRQLGLTDAEITDRMGWVAELMGLADKLDTNPADLSSVEKKFCAMGTVVMMGPGTVILDEPTCGLDVAGEQRLSRAIDALRERGTLCVAISHDTKFVTRNFPRTVVLCRGRVIDQGPTEEVFTHVDVLRRSFVIPPPVARVARAAGMRRVAFTVDELIKNIVEEREA